MANQQDRNGVAIGQDGALELDVRVVNQGEPVGWLPAPRDDARAVDIGSVEVMYINGVRVIATRRISRG